MRRTRDLEGTRRRILEAAFQEIYVHGFQGTSIDKIVARTDLTKGALFNIFPDKLSVGHAVVDEVVADMLRRQWVVPLEGADDCLEVIARSFAVGARELEGMPVHYGCPLNNLAQEMSAIDAGFKTRTLRVFDQWIAGFQRALERGQQAGVVRSDAGARNLRSVLESLRAASYRA